MKETKDFYMHEALKEAKKVDSSSLPIGCIIIDKNTGKIVSRANNDSSTKKDPFSHAEIKALKNLTSSLKHNFLNDYEIYVTLEPCLTCFSIIKSFNIRNINYGLPNSKYGYSNFVNEAALKKLTITKNIKSEESHELLKNFFNELRKEKKKDEKH